MTKSLYSLILTDEVVQRIDRAADQAGTNRSNLINQILADYVSYTTPEMRIRHIFEHIENLIKDVPPLLLEDKTDKTLSLKTSLDCKYRPTVRYSVELYRNKNRSIGELKVLYRSHSEEILYNLNTFFLEIINIEKKYLTHQANYSLSEGKFVRTFVVPDDANYSQEELARAISDYIKNFDLLLKKFIMGKYSTITGLDYDYKIYISKSILI